MIGDPFLLAMTLCAVLVLLTWPQPDRDESRALGVGLFVFSIPSLLFWTALAIVLLPEGAQALTRIISGCDNPDLSWWDKFWMCCWCV